MTGMPSSKMPQASSIPAMPCPRFASPFHIGKDPGRSPSYQDHATQQRLLTGLDKRSYAALNLSRAPQATGQPCPLRAGSAMPSSTPGAVTLDRSPQMQRGIRGDASDVPVMGALPR